MPQTPLTTNSNTIKTGGIVDGANVALGAKADAAWSSGAGTVIALLKALVGKAVAPTPTGSTSITAASGNVANASAVATLAAAAAKTTYITGFTVTGLGATAAGVALVAVTGTITGTLTYVFPVPIGATVGATPLNVQFPQPVPASAVNTAIVVTVPALGSGNTNAAVVATGFQL
jgi:hypothetical protein